MQSREEFWKGVVRPVVLYRGHYVFSSCMHGDTHSNFVSCRLTSNSRKRLIDECLAEVEAFHHISWHKLVVVGTGCGYWYAAMLADRLDGSSVYAERDRLGQFVLRRGQEEFIEGKVAILLDDVLSTGTSARLIHRMLTRCNVPLIGALFLLNRSAGEEIDSIFGHGYAIRSRALFHEPMQTWSREECPLCKAGKPFSVQFGKGEEEMFLRGQPQKS